MSVRRRRRRRQRRWLEEQEPGKSGVGMRMLRGRGGETSGGSERAEEEDGQGASPVSAPARLHSKPSEAVSWQL
eukprot:4827707-Pyramimonas_sp.AAC.1